MEQEQELMKQYGMNPKLSVDDNMHLRNIQETMKSKAIKPKESMVALHKGLGLKLSISKCRKTAERMEM